jgi:phospholipid transport system substrate-binding protein
MFRRTFLQAGIIFLTLASCLGAVRAQTAQDAEKFIQNLAQTAISTVAEKSLSQNERDDRFRRLFVSSFDLPQIARFVLARYWRQATPDQQRDFLKEFEDFNVLTWARRFQDYNGEKLDTRGATKEGDRGWLVDSQILRNQGPPIPVQWRLRQGDDGNLRIVDIIVEGVSMAITNRSDYNAALQSNGGNISALLSTMRAKIDQLRTAG